MSILSKPALDFEQGKVLSYARFSKEEQNPRSTDAQFATINRRIPREFASYEIHREKDEGISGEELSRPGINRVRELIKKGEFKLLIAEDVARFFRDRAEPFKLAGLCIDHGCRLIALNDGVDTADERWQDAMLRAVDRHSSCNEDTAKRIQRAIEDRWVNGFAMGPLFPGYTRVPVDPVAHARTHRGPYLDSKDEKWTPVILEVYGRIARGDSASEVAAFANAKGLPTMANCKGPKHNGRTIKTLVKNSTYKGIEAFGKTAQKKHYGSGKHVAVRQTPRTRSMPHLIHVPEVLWEQANKAIKDRDKAKEHPSGKQNPLHRIPRDSRSIFSNHAYCTRCGGKMLMVGRAGGGYRCGNALKGKCWVKATVKRDLVEKAVLQAVANALLELPDMRDVITAGVQKFVLDREDSGERLARLTAEMQTLEAEIKSIVKKVVLAKDLEELFLEELRNRKARQEELNLQINALESDMQLNVSIPESETIVRLARTIAGELLAKAPESKPLLRQLTTPILFVPYQRIDCDLVVLRATFDVRFLSLLQTTLPGTLLEEIDHKEAKSVRKAVVVDCFDQPLPVRLAATARDRRSAGESVKVIADALQTNRKSVYEALRLADMMESKGVSEPYRELLVAPASASRWRSRIR